MNNIDQRNQDLLKQARAALYNRDQDQAAAILTKIVKRGTANAKAKVANDTICDD